MHAKAILIAVGEESVSGVSAEVMAFPAGYYLKTAMVCSESS